MDGGKNSSDMVPVHKKEARVTPAADGAWRAKVRMESVG
jgi:hypothetical protein